ncbi:hypothetical protein P8452_30413 [Trifolium repens]|nr:hypothetical protein P8452_30413 [Trifolium repens]
MNDMKSLYIEGDKILGLRVMVTCAIRAHVSIFGLVTCHSWGPPHNNLTVDRCHTKNHKEQLQSCSYIATS